MFPTTTGVNQILPRRMPTSPSKPRSQRSPKPNVKAEASTPPFPPSARRHPSLLPLPPRPRPSHPRPLRPPLSPRPHPLPPRPGSRPRPPQPRPSSRLTRPSSTIPPVVRPLRQSSIRAPVVRTWPSTPTPPGPGGRGPRGPTGRLALTGLQLSPKHYSPKSQRIQHPHQHQHQHQHQRDQEQEQKHQYY